MRHALVVFAAFLAVAYAKNCPAKKASSKLVCYYSKLTDIDGCYCTHAILPANSDVKSVERAREQMKGVKVLVTVNEFNQGLLDLLKTSKLDGLEVNLKKLTSKHDLNDFISTVRSKLGSDLYLAVSVPPKAEVLAKYFDFKGLSKHADLFILQTAFLGASQNVTFHPSRLSGLWDMQNTDSVVDLVSGLGAPLSKLAIAAPVQAFHFKLQSEEYTAPGSPALEVKSLTRNQLCTVMNGGTNWTLERDQDQAGPYIFSKDQWIAFEDATSMDIKAKYARVRGLAGVALKDVSQDGGENCGPSMLEAVYNGLTRQSRAPRGAVLHSLEREILETAKPLDRVHVSPYRISRIIDTEGKVHAVREDTRTEFECSRQGYFVHPRSCNRFYRCVKFDQLVDDFNVFEFDCPAGLAFDERVEVCVWPGSLRQGAPCSGSSEIAPVPRQRFVCPSEPGYYADPENCRWFFACLDHGRSALEAYEFRCPFGLVFDSDRLLCEWPWLVPKCGSGLGIDLASEFAYGGHTAGHGPGLLLQYDGLGPLGVVGLGGISGKIAQPVVYSNVGTASLGFHHGGLGGLGVKAAQSLENAGLLRANLGAGQLYYGNAGLGLGGNIQYINGAAGLHTNLNEAGGASNVNLQYNTGFGLRGLGTAYRTDNAGANLVGVKTSDLNQYQVSLGSGVSTGDSGAHLTQGAVQYQGLNSQADLDSVVSQGGVNILQHDVGNAFGVKTAQSSDNLDQGLNIYQGNLGSLDAANVNEFGAKTSQVFAQYQGQLGQQSQTLQYAGGVGDNSQNTATDLGAKSYQTVTQYNNQDKPIVVDNTDFTQHGANEVNLGYTGVDVATFGTKLAPQGVLQYHGAIGQAAVGTLNSNQGGDVLNTFDINAANAFGTKASQSISQGEGVAGNINIIGGGYSAVGAAKSGVEISNNGVNIDAIVQSTPAPVSIATYSSVPTVTSVPLPKLKTAAGFESYNGGVIANVPELQYKVSGTGALANISSNFVNFISTTPSSLLVNEGILQQTQDQSGATIPTDQGAASYSYQSLDTSLNNGGYIYSKPTVEFKEGPQQTVVDRHSYIGSSTIRPALAVIQQNAVVPNTIQKSEGYVYTKPAVAFEETPVKTVSSFSISTPSTIRPLVVEQKVQPIVPVQLVVSVTPTVAVQPISKQPAFSFAFHRQESSGEQAVIYGQRQQPQIVVSSTPRPVLVEQRPQVIISSTVAPIVEQKITQPAVSSYNFAQQTGLEGYVYPRPTVAFEERPVLQPVVRPVVQSVQPIVQSVQPVVQPVQPVTISRFSIRKPVVQPTVTAYQEVQPAVTSYNIQQPAVVHPTAATYNYEQQYKSEGYQYRRPSVVFSQPSVTYQNPAVSTYTYQDVAQKAVEIQPAAVSTYVSPTTPSPSVLVQTPAVSTYTYNIPTSTARPVVVQKQPAVVSSYSYEASSTAKPVQFGGYDYPKPSVAFETPTPVVTYDNRQLVEEVPFVKKTAYVTGQVRQPVVVENYQAPALAKANAYSQSVDTSSAYLINNVRTVSTTPLYEQEFYSTPIYRQPVSQVYLQSTPRPTFKSTVSSIITAKSPVTEAPNFYYYDSRYTSTPKALVNEGYSYPTPKVAFEETPVQPVSSTTYLQPTREYLPAQTVTSSRPVFQYSFNALDNQEQYVSTPSPFVVQSTTPLAREYIPVKSRVQITTPQPVFVVPEVSTAAPVRSRVRYTTTSRPLEVATTSASYIPVRPRVRITTSTPVVIPSTEYQPLKTRVSVFTLPTGAPVEVTTLNRDYLPARSGVTTGSLIGEVGSRRPAKITIIKQNDFQPVLAAKLGAQCTCISNSLQTGKRKKIIIVEDDDDDDGYVVANNNQGGILLENYQYNPQDAVEITPTPQVYSKSTTNEIVSAPTPPYVRRRVIVRPLSSTAAYEADQTDVSSGVSDREIATAVKTGLKLVKQAAKEGAKEGAEEVISNYGNVNVRGTIECERAGLFRHPSQCNKFYTCRWDCTKNKFTVHTFNCPIHLTFDSSLGACNWPSQGPACLENTLLPSA